MPRSNNKRLDDNPPPSGRQVIDPFEPTPQLRREAGGNYFAPDDGRFGAGHDRNTLARLRAREQQLQEGHWRTFVCVAGHVIEWHRQAGGVGEQPRCPICGRPSAHEAPAVTALREHRIENAPLALLSRAFDAIGEWAQQHLDAKTWTVRSEAQRKAAMIRGDQGERHSADQLKSPFPR